MIKKYKYDTDKRIIMSTRKSFGFFINVGLIKFSKLSTKFLSSLNRRWGLDRNPNLITVDDGD